MILSRAASAAKQTLKTLSDRQLDDMGLSRTAFVSEIVNSVRKDLDTTENDMSHRQIINLIVNPNLQGLFSKTLLKMLRRIFIEGFGLVHTSSVYSFFKDFTQLGHCVCSLALNKLPHFSHNISNTLRIIYLFNPEIVQISRKSNLVFHAYKVIFLK